jgi:protein-disulfide isomerase
MATDSNTQKITIWFIIGFLVLVAVGVVIAGAYSNSSSSNTTTPAGFVATTVPAITSADWTMGNASATVSFVEYGDYECPACAEYSPIVKQLITDYGNRVLFAFRNFPLYTIHPDAGVSAQAAEAAGLQGKYWEMHDLLYSKQNDWVTTDPSAVAAKYFNGYAQSLGLDVAKFDADMSSAQVANKIAADVTSGNAASIDHTPTFFVNLKQIPNPADYAGFKKVLDAALALPTVTAVVSPATSTTSTAQ